MVGASTRSADALFRRNLLGVYVLLVVINAGAWGWALLAFRGQPVLLGVGAVVYGLGLRHAVDADHIAAIDNVTRKLLQRGTRSTAIGLWFALGHSSVILIATATVVAAAGALSRLQAYRQLGGVLSTSVSGLFLLLVGVMNLCILAATVRTLRRLRGGHAVDQAELDVLFAGSGLLSRIFRPLFRCVSRPWHMMPLGFLFGLSFDTATEVSLFSISATQVAHGVSFGTTLVYPLLFAAGMSLLDTTDGILMIGAYRWAVTDPLRKLRYNMTITLMSIGIALFIGALQISTLGVRWLGLTGPIAGTVNMLADNLDYLGVAIIGVFVLAWIISATSFRLVGREPLASTD